MFIPAMTPRTGPSLETAPNALAKYGAVMGTANPQAQLARPATRPGGQPTVAVQAAAATQPKSDAQNARAVVRQEAAQHAPQSDKLEQAREILDQVRVKLAPGMREATIALTPAHLGRIGIKLEMRDKELVAVIRAERPEALQALEENLPDLRAMLEESGITAGEFDLGLGFQGEAQESFDAPTGSAPAASTEVEIPAEDPHSYQLASALARGGIDLIA